MPAVAVQIALTPPRPFPASVGRHLLALALLATTAGSAATPATAPVIMQQPTNLAAKTLGSVTFEVKASGTPPLSYIWYRDGTTFAGWTRSSLTLVGVTTNDVGRYTVTVSNAAGSVTSEPAQFTIGATPASKTAALAVVAPATPAATPVAAPAPPPAAALSPAWAAQAPQSPIEYALPDEKVSLRVNSDGTPPLKYQWWRNDKPISGATAAVYEFKASKDDDNARYVCIAANTKGSKPSNTITLVIGKKP
ncbi:immunoglobulin domain-containing protein [Horticoccus sp. 23ND18S-11]|uniref:immunoglobulin domain-containing protein n=1 Tax=Horticoccus sp. 23ND18S-11 TaxID=3391832 RepID=UPI0039C8E28A